MQYTKGQLEEILDKHHKWWCGEAGGERANLEEANLEGAYLGGANLEGAYLGRANLEGAYLGGANLRGANLRRANLGGAYLGGANLRGAYLKGAYLGGANLRGANLEEANLEGAYLGGANLEGAYLGGANLRRANLKEANLKEANLGGAYLGGADLGGAYLKNTKLPHFQIPQEGDLIVFKKAGGSIVKLRIPDEAKRTATLVGRKCRAEYAKVIEITRDGGYVGKAISTPSLGTEATYKVGQIVRPDKYDPDIKVECTHGIHFFLTREEAEEWGS